MFKNILKHPGLFYKLIGTCIFSIGPAITLVSRTQVSIEQSGIEINRIATCLIPIVDTYLSFYL